MLEFKNVTKDYGSIQALKDVSFSIGKGELVYITGSSGAGKTTILKLILREILPTSDTIIFDKTEIQKMKRRKVPELRRSIGAIFQDYKLLEDRTVAENIAVALAVSQIEKKMWDEQISDVLKLVGLTSRSQLFPSQLSGGEIQRVAIARALVNNPKIIFADEPTGNLDQRTADRIMDIFYKINDEGKTVIVATHHQDALKRRQGRKIEFEKGKLVSDSKSKKKKIKKEDESS